MNLLLLAQPARWCAATAPHRAAAAPRLMAAVRRLGTASGGGHTEPLPATLHQTAEQGPQPETLFRPDAGHLQEGEGREGKEEELPFPSIPHPDYGVERPQEQTAPEPENPLPDLPPNHPDEEPRSPGIEEVPMPQRSEPELPIPDIVPTDFPMEVPPTGPPAEAVPSSAPPEFSPGVPSELPDRGGSEINFPGH